MLWYDLSNIKKTKSNQFVADVRVPSDSPWFVGHFPDEPILPGVAQLDMALSVISHFSKRQIKIKGVERVRFKKIIRPDDPLRVIAEPRDGRRNSYFFRITIQQELVCSGFLTIK